MTRLEKLRKQIDAGVELDRDLVRDVVRYVELRIIAYHDRPIERSAAVERNALIDRLLSEIKEGTR